MVYLVLLVCALTSLPVASGAAPPPAALDRGRLSLAWDAHDDGLCEEALGYLDGLSSAPAFARDGAWLRAECLYDLGRLAEAAEALGRPEARGLPDLHDFALDVVWDWVWQASARGDFGEAERAVVVGRGLAGDDPYLDALEALVAFRRGVARSLGRSPPADPVAIRSENAPEGAGWVAASPLDGVEAWVPETTPDEWLVPSQRFGTLWLRVNEKVLFRELTRFAAALGISVVEGGEGVELTRGRESMLVDPDEVRYRGAVEGTGAIGAARLAVARARDTLETQGELVSWVASHSAPAVVSRQEGRVVLVHPSTGRRFTLEPGRWVEAFAPEDEAWVSEWGDIVTELGRPARPFRCFCGREATLREVLTLRPDAAVVVERDGDRTVVLQALCPLHVQRVTPAVLAGWGVGVLDAVERARTDGAGRLWDLAFERGRVGETPYLVLGGGGVSGLPRRPDLLRAALEAVDGKGGQLDAVRVSVPAPSVLVVMGEGARPQELQAASLRALRGAAGPGAIERLDYETVVRLPSQGAGRFRVRSGP